MSDLERCVERCPIVARLPEEERLRILGGQAVHLCPNDLPNGQLGPLCGLPNSESKNLATREAIQVSRITELSTV